MADETRLASSLQLSVLAAICFDEGIGAAVAAQVNPEHFDNVWRDFAAQVLRYRKKYGKPPGENYLDDLASRLPAGKDNLLKRQLIPDLFAEAEGLNAEYVATRVDDFVQRQILKAALYEAGDRFSQDDEGLVGDVRDILGSALKTKRSALDAGLFLDDPKALSYLSHDRDDVVSLGIPELDRLRVGLIAKQLLLYLGPKGTGKSWFCIHCAKQALLQRLKVVHFSLEMTLDQLIPRYYQSLFGVAQDGDKFNRTTLEFDELGRLSGFKTKSTRPRLNMAQPEIRKILRKKLNDFGARLGSLVIKEVPTGSMTVAQFAGHLDYLEEVEGFVPNVVIVDYPKLMKVDRANMRLDLGRNVEELRGEAGKRNFALVAPHQGTRSTIGAKRVRSSDAGEDISVIQTADIVLAYSRTEAEEDRGLGRLSVEHLRNAKSGSQILLTQSYETGQYVLESAVMQKAYWDRLREVGGEDDAEE